MIKPNTTSIIILSLLALPSSATSRTWHIVVDGSGDAPTIQAGIDSSSVGDTVLVGLGTYFENINFAGKDIIVKSLSGPQVTAIDGSSANDSVVLFVNRETRGAIMDGFTLTGGAGHLVGQNETRGGGIYCRDSSPTIRNNIIRNNRANNSLGGGVSVDIGLGPLPPPESVAPLLEGNVFESNAARLGGGLAVYSLGAPTILGNVFKSNTAETDGGAIFLSIGRTGDRVYLLPINSVRTLIILPI